MKTCRWAVLCCSTYYYCHFRGSETKQYDKPVNNWRHSSQYGPYQIPTSCLCCRAPGMSYHTRNGAVLSNRRLKHPVDQWKGQEHGV